MKNKEIRQSISKADRADKVIITNVAPEFGSALHRWLTTKVSLSVSAFVLRVFGGQHLQQFPVIGLQPIG